MTWQIEWTYSGEASLKRLRNWVDAGTIDAAVQRYAATGEGDVYKAPGDHWGALRLRVGRYRILATLDRGEGVMRVLRVYRT